MKRKTGIISRLMLEGCQVNEQIGSSPLGTLYNILHPEFGSCVLKHFSDALAQKENYLENTLQPLEKLKQFEHPNLGKIYHWETAPQAFLLRELVVGASLSQYLQMKQRLDAVRSTQIILDVAMGLLAGYPFGIVYKNCKPSNIILLPDATACLVDISLPPSNPNYIAPEQWKGEKSDARSDIYALGIIYYEMLSGKPPFHAGTPDEIKNNHLNRPPAWKHLPADTPHPVRDILDNMLRKDREKRYRSVLPLIGDLREALKKMGVAVKPVPSSFARPKTGEIQKPEAKEDKPDKAARRRALTTMLVAQAVPEEEADAQAAPIDARPEAFLEKSPPAEDEELALEEVYLSREEMTNALEQALQQITHIEQLEQRRDRHSPLPRRIVYFPKEYESQVIEHLQKIFRSETWLLKDSGVPGEMEVEIDLEQAYILLHFYQYEDLLQKTLKEELISESMGETINLSEDDVICLEEEEGQRGGTVNLSEDDVVGAEDDGGREGTINLDEDDVICLEEDGENAEVVAVEEEYVVETINDITIGGRGKAGGAGQAAKSRPRFRNPDLAVGVDFDHAYQTMGWIKFLRKHGLKKGEHFDVKGDAGEWSGVREFVIHLEKLESYHREQENIARIKEFFQADYDIVELDRGGMGAVLKLTAKNDPTFLSLRPENYWARQRFIEYLRVMKDAKGKEIVYAEIPKGTEFVVKVAFEGYEESLIQEAQVLSKIAEDPHICHTIIGAVQQGRLFALDEKSDQTRIGYYLMLEYAQQGNAEQLYHRFPEGRLPPTIAFAVMYGMVQTLCKLEQLGTIHRDIKPQNILLDHNGVPKLSDFGLVILATEESGTMTEDRKRLLRIMDEEFLHISRRIEEMEGKLSELKGQKLLEPKKNKDTEVKIGQFEVELADWKRREQERIEALKGKYRMVSAAENATKGKFAGSPYYAAPEQLDPQAILTPKCDLYQLGAVMFTLLTGKKPVEGRTTFDIMSRILYSPKPRVSDFVKGQPVVDALGNLIYEMMAHEPEKRIDADMARERLGQILFDHALELKKKPRFTPPAAVQTRAHQERWAVKVAFAEELHQKCVDTIFSTIFQSRQQPALRKDLEKIVFQCRGCGKKLHVYRHMHGKKGNCPGCGKRILIQLIEEEQHG